VSHAMGAGVAKPAADAWTGVAWMQQSIRQAWGRMDTPMQEAMAPAERDQRNVATFLPVISPAEREAFVKTWRARIMAPSNAAERQLNLAELLAVIGTTAFHHGRSGNRESKGALADRTRLPDPANRRMHAAIRSYSPTCNATWPDVMQNSAS
jgi:hypothetical protein